MKHSESGHTFRIRAERKAELDDALGALAAAKERVQDAARNYHAACERHALARQTDADLRAMAAEACGC